MKRKKLIIIIAAVLLVAGAAGGTLFLRMRGSDDASKEVPVNYQIKKEEIPALPTHQKEVVVDKTEKGKEKDGKKDSKQEGKGDPQPEVAYVYRNLPDLHASLKDYVKTLTGEEEGFSFVDETLHQARKMPDLNQEEGNVLLARNGEEGKVLKVNLVWEEKICTVLLSDAEGEVLEAEEPKLFSSMEAIDYLRTLSPKDLNLKGDSMAEYEIYVLDGGVMINDQPCIRLNVCSNMNDMGTNIHEGKYYLSNDGTRLYYFDDSTHQMQELKTAEPSEPA